MTSQEIKNYINSKITENTFGNITGEELNYILKEIVNLIDSKNEDKGN
jgi:hypothetical protein